MSFTVRLAGSTNHGRIRTNNEDNFYFSGKYLAPGTLDLKTVMSGCQCTSDPVCLAVFDGMGGENAGEAASLTAASVFASCVGELENVIKAPKDFLKEACFKMNHAVVIQAAEEHLGQTGTTASILYLWQDMAYVCNVGDSAVFRLRGNELKQITKSHTNEDFLMKQGLTARKPTLTQFIGISEEEMMIEPYIAKGRLAAGDKFLVCSDGLTDMVLLEQIASCMYYAPSVSDAAAGLLDMALNAGGRDNVTVIVCEVTGDSFAG